MCQSIADGGKRCRCTTPEAAAKKRALRNEAQKRYLKRKRAAAADVLSPEVASEGIETSVATVPKKESKALTKARQRLELARRAGASQESIAVIEKRIAKLVPKVKKKVDAAPAMETPASEPAPAIMETAEHADTASPWRGLTEALEESRENAPSIEDAFETYLADTVEAVHHDAVAQLNAIIAASKAKQDEENAARLRAAMTASKVSRSWLKYFFAVSTKFGIKS